MFENLNIFKISSAMSRHAGARQAVISQNVANADTPGYVSRDLPAFKSVYKGEGGVVQKATRAGHLHGSVSAAHSRPFEDGGMASPDGNTVSIEVEMLKAVDTKRQHDRALAIYKSALGVLRSTLGGR